MNLLPLGKTIQVIQLKKLQSKKINILKKKLFYKKILDIRQLQQLNIKLFPVDDRFFERQHSIFKIHLKDKVLFILILSNLNILSLQNCGLRKIFSNKIIFFT